MTRALSQDLRDRVIAVVDGGMSCNRAAERFGVAISSAVRWVRAWRTEGRAEALPQGGDLRSHRIEAGIDRSLRRTVREWHEELSPVRRPGAVQLLCEPRERGTAPQRARSLVRAEHGLALP